ncbi:MAG: beta-N-acetylhexosaminidase, partial [Chloroflexia bacterium]|nr:beta-N-acetylhexosaminidase [Chloroflexia bacterium]
GLAALAGYEATGIIATAKHFPGHGDTAVDSHLGLPIVEHGRDRLDAVEFAPFRAAIAAGVPAIMSAHIVYTAFDDRPATLSRPILTDLLRGELGFEGVIFTDALDMQAVAKRYGQAGAARRAKAAGVDITLPVGPLTEQIAVFDTLRQAAATGEIAEAAFTATAERLDRLRQRYGLSHAMPPLTPLAASLDAAAFEIARRGIRVTERQPLLPIDRATRMALIDCVQPRWTLAEEATARAELLRELVERAFPRATCIAVGPQPAPAEIAAARAVASQSELTIFVTRDAFRYEHQVALGQTLAALDPPLIHVAARAPYDEAHLPEAAATLLTFGDPPLSLRALVAILGGDTESADRSD